jgi:hypothetical protein
VTIAYAVSLSCDVSLFCEGVTRSFWSQVITAEMGLGRARDDRIKAKKEFLFNMCY